MTASGKLPAREKIRWCFERMTVRLALKVALVVGTILNLINHFDVLSGAPITRVVATQIVLTYIVPYCVSTHGQVWGRRG